MQTIYIKFNYPDYLDYPKIRLSELSEEAFNRCFIIGKYPNEAMALMAYANTPCSWSTLLDENANIAEFVEEAKQHLRDYDEEWLEENFT